LIKNKKKIYIACGFEVLVSLPDDSMKEEYTMYDQIKNEYNSLGLKIRSKGGIVI